MQFCYSDPLILVAVDLSKMKAIQTTSTIFGICAIFLDISKSSVLRIKAYSDCILKYPLPNAQYQTSRRNHGWTHRVPACPSYRLVRPGLAQHEVHAEFHAFWLKGSCARRMDGSRMVPSPNGLALGCPHRIVRALPVKNTWHIRK